MLDPRIKEYLAQIGIHKVNELDTALIEAFGQSEGEKHIIRLTELFDQSEARLLYGTGDTPYSRRQEELVDYLNQSLEMSLLAASFYDHIFFRRVMEYLLGQRSFFQGNIFDIGCGNGILTCFLALQHPDAAVTGLELSVNAVRMAEKNAEKLSISNVHFTSPQTWQQAACDTLFSCRTVHENIAWKAVSREGKSGMSSMEELTKQYKTYARELAALVRARGHLVSVEHYEDDIAYAAFIHALEYAGFCQVKGTCMQFSCKNGDRTATFQAMVFQKTGV